MSTKQKNCLTKPRICANINVYSQSYDEEGFIRGIAHRELSFGARQQQ